MITCEYMPNGMPSCEDVAVGYLDTTLGGYIPVCREHFHRAATNGGGTIHVRFPHYDSRCTCGLRLDYHKKQPRQK